MASAWSTRAPPNAPRTTSSSAPSPHAVRTASSVSDSSLSGGARSTRIPAAISSATPASPSESPSPTQRSMRRPEPGGMAGPAVGRDHERVGPSPARPRGVEAVARSGVAVGKDDGLHGDDASDAVARPADARLRAVSEPTDHPAIQRVLDAASRKGVTLEVRMFDESTHTAAEAAARGRSRARPDRQVPGLRRAGGRWRRSSRSSASSRGPIASTWRGWRRSTGEPDIRRATAREANDLTGFVIGGIPPIGHARPVRVIMDPDLGRYPTVWAAAGLPTAVFEVPPANAAASSRTRRSRRSPRSAGRPTSRPRPPGCHRPTPARDLDPAREPGRAAQRCGHAIRAACAHGGGGAAAARRRPCSPCRRPAGTLIDLGPHVSEDPDALCRAELRLEGPRGAWTARFASVIYDEPRALYWDTAGLLVVAYGFHAFGLDAGDRRAALGAPLGDATDRAAGLSAAGPRPRPVGARDVRDRPDGTVAWRVAHSDVVTAADLSAAGSC